MQSALHGADGYAKHIRRLPIFHALVIDKQQCSSELLGQIIDRRPHPIAGLLGLHLFVGGAAIAREHLDE